jgi:hypothetical protein
MNRVSEIPARRDRRRILLLPPSLEEMINPNHPVKVVNQIIDSLDIDTLRRK